MASSLMIFSSKWITKALTRLRICAGCSAPLLFGNHQRHVFPPQGTYNVTEQMLKKLLLHVLKILNCQPWKKINFQEIWEKLQCRGLCIIVELGKEFQCFDEKNKKNHSLIAAYYPESSWNLGHLRSIYILYLLKYFVIFAYRRRKIHIFYQYFIKGG